MTTPSTLQDKVAFVTGSGTGIGRATALSLSQAGAKVVIAELNPTTGSETATSIASQTGNEVLSVHCDVSQSVSIEAAVRETVTHFGSLDIAVNNAGLHPDSTLIESLDEAYWNAVISVNLTGVALSMKWELRQMVAQGRGGSIVNMASGTIFRAQKGMAAYVATKHGVIGLTQVAALENGKHGIRVNALAPGGVATELSKAALEKMGSSEEAAAEGNSLFKRFARPEEIGRAILWMVSDGSAYMTGTTIPLDAGMSIM